MPKLCMDTNSSGMVFNPVNLWVKGGSRKDYPLPEKSFRLLPMILVTIQKLRVKHD